MCAIAYKDISMTRYWASRNIVIFWKKSKLEIPAKQIGIKTKNPKQKIEENKKESNRKKGEESYLAEAWLTAPPAAQCPARPPYWFVLTEEEERRWRGLTREMS
jgi:hypothetical protein